MVFDQVRAKSADVNFGRFFAHHVREEMVLKRYSRKVVLLIFGLAVGSTSPIASGQYAFNHDSFQTGIDPTGVVLADFNGDH
jgi:hypothetical protein